MERNNHRSVRLNRHVKIAVASRWLELILVIVVSRVNLVVPDIDISLVIPVVRYGVPCEAGLEICDWDDEKSGVIGPWIKLDGDLRNEFISPVLVGAIPLANVAILTPWVVDK